MRRARLWFWLLVIVIVAAITLLFFSYRVFEDLAKGESGTVPRRLLDELVGSASAVALFPALAWLSARHPLRRGQLARSIPVHLVGLAAYSAAHTSLLAITRGALYPLLGFAVDPYLPRLLTRSLQELAHDVIAYALFIGLETAWRAGETLRDIQLRTLRLQLQPHFLFNALNTIAEAIHDDPAAAEAMLEHLSELLRHSLRMAPTEAVPLAEELAILHRYTALLEARFGDRLRVEVDVAPGAEELLVPSLLLQPLVENAIRHGATGQLLEVAIRARCRGGALVIEVVDNGPGAASGAQLLGSGLGLGGTSERLRLLHGGRAAVKAGNREGGGFAVELTLPARRSSR